MNDAVTTEAVAGKLDRDAFQALIGDVPVIDDPVQVKLKSRDFHWFSPILRKTLAGLVADLVVVPRSETEVIRVAAACARLGLPLTVRGAGTGNYGQAMPLHGGILMEMTSLNTLCWISAKRDHVRAQAGMRMSELDKHARAQGCELRVHPSTKRSATVGGYFAGGSAGVGAINFGGLREPGNLLGARVVTLEEEPRVIELRGPDTGLVNRTFGSTGIITEIEMPLAPMHPWRDCIVTFNGFMPAVRFGHALGSDGAIIKKLITPLAAPMVAYVQPVAARVPQGADVVICMISEASMARFGALVKAHGGTIACDDDAIAAETDPARVPLFEYTFGHTTLNALKVDRTLTYLQTLFETTDQLFAKLPLVLEQFGDELLQHLEFYLYDGHLACSGVPVVRYTTPERLQEIMDFHEANGISVANPHISTVEDGSRYKRAPGDQLKFKAEVDPLGLLNPGKMRSYMPVRAWQPHAAVEARGR